MTLIAMTTDDFDPTLDHRFMLYRNEAVRLLHNSQTPLMGYMSLAEFVVQAFDSEEFDITDLFMRVLSVCKAEGNFLPTIDHTAKLFNTLRIDMVPEQHRPAYIAVCASISQGICGEISGYAATAMRHISMHLGVQLHVEVHSEREYPQPTMTPAVEDERNGTSTPNRIIH